MINLYFVIPGDPRTKKNSQKTVSYMTMAGTIAHRPLPSAAFREYQSAAGFFIPCKWEMITKPVNIRYTFYMQTRRKVDATNLCEAMDDILVHYGVIVDDNRDIVASHDGTLVLYDKARPRVEVTITGKENYEQWGLTKPEK